MKLFSKASEYAIRAMLRIAETGSFDRFSPKEICATAGIPEAFGRKALAAMVKAKMIQGTRGPGGGYSFVRDPRDVSLLDVVLAVDGPGAFKECPLGIACSAREAIAPPVPGSGYHRRWICRFASVMAASKRMMGNLRATCRIVCITASRTSGFK